MSYSPKNTVAPVKPPAHTLGMSSFIEKTKPNNSEKCKENLNTEARPHHQSLQQNDVTNTLLSKANSTKPECKRHKSRSKKRKNSKTKKSVTRANSIRNNFFNDVMNKMDDMDLNQEEQGKL